MKTSVRKVFQLLFRKKGLSLTPPSPVRGRALVVYVQDPFWVSRVQISHQNQLHSVWLVQCLLDLGYRVDVFDYKDALLSVVHDYDLSIGMGPRFEYLVAKGHVARNNIYLATGQRHDIANNNIEKRYDYFYERNGKRLKNTYRLPRHSFQLEGFRHVIAFGGRANKLGFEAWGKHVHSVSNTCFGQIANDVTKKSRNHFICIAGKAAIAKGVDLVIEAFASNKNCSCDIYGEIGAHYDLIKYYRKRMGILDNIDVKGFHLPDSKEMVDSLSRSAFTILPSATEGQPGAVVHAMAHGVIPIVSKECGFDFSAIDGIELNEVNLKSTICAIERASKMDDGAYYAMQTTIQKRVKILHTEKAFKDAVMSAISTVEEFK